MMFKDGELRFSSTLLVLGIYSVCMVPTVAPHNPREIMMDFPQGGMRNQTNDHTHKMPKHVLSKHVCQFVVGEVVCATCIPTTQTTCLNKHMPHKRM